MNNNNLNNDTIKIIYVEGSNIMQGKVKWFNDEKGFGFIEYKEGIDIFVHYSSIIEKGHKTLNEGDIVSYDIVETDKGYQAKNVSILKRCIMN